MLAIFAALSLFAGAQTAPAKPLVPIDQATWSALIAKALTQTPRDESGMLIYTLDNHVAVTSTPCPAGTAPENRFVLMKLKDNRYPLVNDVDIDIFCTDSRGFLAAGVAISARSSDRTLYSEDMYTEDPDPKKASRPVLHDGKLDGSVVDVTALQAAVTRALRSLNAP